MGRKDLITTILGHSRDPQARKLDPQGIKLAKECAAHSQWARDVALERGIKYTEMKRGGGRGGGVFKAVKGSKSSQGKRRLSLCERMENEDKIMSARGSILG